MTTDHLIQELKLTAARVRSLLANTEADTLLQEECAHFLAVIESKLDKLAGQESNLRPGG